VMVVGSMTFAVAVYMYSLVRLKPDTTARPPEGGHYGLVRLRPDTTSFPGGRSA
jgi:hypothetical protein